MNEPPTRATPPPQDRSARRRRLLGLLVLVLLIGAALLVRRPPWLLTSLLLRGGVVSVQGSALRREYEEQVAHLCDPVPTLRAGGMSEVDIARRLHGERRALGVRYKDLTPEPLRTRIYEVNQRRYGDPLGPSFDYLERHNQRDGAINYAAIIQGACRPNRDVNALLK